jgi:hypothetical protein
MAKYNPFRYYTEGKYRKRPLKSNAPLLLKIKNGDFDYSPYFLEAKDNERLYDEMYEQFMNTAQISDIHNKKVEAHQYAKMKRIKAQKLMEVGINEENQRLTQLKKELANEFRADLWEEAMEAKLNGRGATEDLYWWYKKKVGMGQTPSEIAIQLGRTTTKGLQP